MSGRLTHSILRPWQTLACGLLCACCCAPACKAGTAKKATDSRGEFSADAVSLWDLSASHRRTVISPDHLKRIVVYEPVKGDVTSEEFFITVDGKRIQLFAGHVDPEVLWSPDSKAFAETYSDGGAVGTFHAVIYYVEKDTLRAVEPTAEVTKEFLSHPRRCFDPEDPNIGAIKWMNDSSEILVAAETLPHSNCDNMGTFRAYAIGLPGGDIVKSYGQIEAKKLFWKHLGTELRGADDDCILKPGSCDIPQLHLSEHHH
jgi:hypothetical protein